MFDMVVVACDCCGKHYEVDRWEHARTMIEAIDGHSAYRHVYLWERRCICGNIVTVEAQGFQPPWSELVEEWHYRFFDCERVMCRQNSLA